MKLYVKNKITGEKTYIKQRAITKQELVNQLGSIYFQVDEQFFHINDVQAESNDNTAGAMAAGGVVGVVGGVPGVILGGLVGALLGNSTDNEDKIKSDKFNQSKI